MMYEKQELIDLCKKRALKFGDFTLASGKKSSYYLDGKQITLDALGLRLVSQGLLELSQDLKYVAVGGMSIGADPIIGGMLAISSLTNKSLHGFLVRKESKGHGTNQYIEGPVDAGQKVLIVEDVVTTGGSSLLAVERAREYGLEVIGVVGIIDRMQGGAQNFAEHQLPFRTLLTIQDFGIDPPSELT